MQRFLLSVAPLLFCPFIAHAQCPPDTVQCLGAPTVTSEPGYSCIGPWTADQPCFGACYDLPKGEIAILGGGVMNPWVYSVAVEDEYWLVGPPSASPIQFAARLDFKGSCDSANHGPCGMETGNFATWSEFTAVNPGPGVNYTFLPVERLPGESFRVRTWMAVSSPGIPSADLRARLEFVDVPAGWTVASCQGYSVPTPTAWSTWGEVKARYR